MLKTFSKGGVHPPENKLSGNKPIEVLPIPKTVFIPVCQHIGAPAEILVKKNDMVKTGQLIAKAITGPPSANIHSSVSGKVFKIDDIIDTTGYKRKAIIINTDGDDWDENIDKSIDFKNETGLTAEEIIQKISEAGIVGLGGAAFPSHIKLNIRKGDTAQILIINGVECEPYLTADHRLMLEKGLEIMVGISLMMKAIKVDKAVIGIENNKPDAIQNLTSIAAKYKGISVVPLKVKYPQGAEKQLVKAIINRETPSGGLPIAVGAVVHNVGTAYAVYEAIQKNKPLFERVVTVTGKSVSNPSNFKVRIGTPVSALVEATGGLPDDTGKVISGGPMMGKALNSLEVPVVKGMSGVLILKENESARRPVNNCIRCAKCVSVCPMGLEPYLLMVLSQKQMIENLEAENVNDCVECGSCSFTCPSNRPLIDYIRLGKFKIREKNRKK